MAWDEGEPGWSGPLQVRVVEHGVEVQCLVCGEDWTVRKVTVGELVKALSPDACPNHADDQHGPARAGFRPYSEPHVG